MDNGSYFLDKICRMCSRVYAEHSLFHFSRITTLYSYNNEWHYTVHDQTVACYTLFLCLIWCIPLTLVRMKGSSAVTEW